MKYQNTREMSNELREFFVNSLRECLGLEPLYGKGGLAEERQRANALQSNGGQVDAWRFARRRGRTSVL